MKTLFFSFSITNSALTDYFVTACNKLARDYRVVIITDRIAEHPFAIAPEIIVLQWPSERPTTLKAFLFLLHIIIKYKPVTMVSMFGSMNVFVIAGYLMRVKNRIAWNRSIYAKTAEDAKRDRRKKSIYRMATHVFANSNATRRDLGDYFGVPDEKITVIYNAVRDVANHEATYDVNRIVFVGRFHPLKGLDTLLAAMPTITANFPNINLVLAGAKIDGQLAESYREKARTLGILDNVTFAGVLSKPEIARVLAGANCCIVPSLLEAFGFVVIESFATGTPVIGSNSSGIAEVIRDRKDGLLFEPGNAAALADKVIEMLRDKTFRDQCAANCHTHFLENFELQKVTDRLRDEITRISR
jgi:glycosyltransferase involved in cell wall biosynthesis